MSQFIEEIWKSTLLIVAGMILLRLAGRKSISQMTVPTTIIMISIGTVIVQPIAEESIWLALTSAAVFILILFLVELLQLKFNWFESMLTGPAKIVIKDGKLLPDELKKLRLTVDQLELKIRQAGISRIEDIKTATIETNGQLGYELIDEAKPVTLKMMRDLLDSYFQAGSSHQQGTSLHPDLFKEIEVKDAHVKNRELQ